MTGLLAIFKHSSIISDKIICIWSGLFYVRLQFIESRTELRKLSEKTKAGKLFDPFYHFSFQFGFKVFFLNKYSTYSDPQGLI